MRCHGASFLGYILSDNVIVKHLTRDNLRKGELGRGFTDSKGTAHHDREGWQEAAGSMEVETCADIMVDQEPEALGWNQGQTTICKAPPLVPVTHFLLLGPSSVSFRSLQVSTIIWGPSV